MTPWFTRTAQTRSDASNISRDFRATKTSLVEWRETLSRMGVPRESPGWLETDVIHCQAMVLQGELAAADERAKELVEMARQERLNALVCQCLIIRARIAIENGEYAGAIETLENALVAYEVIDQPDPTHRANSNSGEPGMPSVILTTQPAPLTKLSPPSDVNDVVQSAYCLLGLSKIARVQEDLTKLPSSSVLHEQISSQPGHGWARDGPRR